MLAIVPTIFFRLVLPLVLAVACIVRPSIISAFYGILLFVWPFIPGINGGFSASTKRYLIACISISSLALLAQVIFHIVLAALSPYGSALKDCDELASILLMVGLQRLNIPEVGHIIRLICPDIATCVTSIVTFVVCLFYGRSVNQYRAADQSAAATSNDPDGLPTVNVVGPDGTSSTTPKPTDETKSPPSNIVILLARLSDVLVLVLLCSAGVIYPSALSAVYFVAFLIITTWWAAYRPFNVGCFSTVKLILLVYTAMHLLLLYLYQTYQFQEALEPNSLPARLLGMTAIVNSTCQEFWSVKFVRSQQWAIYANPAVLFAFYIYVAFQTVCTYKLLPSESEGSDGTPLRQRRENAPTKSPGTPPRSPTREYRRFFDGSIVLDESENKMLVTIVGFIIRNAYALALIMMMAWAITYHSWLSFVWLALACIIWMVFDSRKACLLLSPFIVLYAEVLLCLQFIYGLNLTQAELPDKDTSLGVPLQQIGLVKPTEAACIPLFIKTFYSLPFFVLLRLWIRERRYRSQGMQPSTYGTFDSSTVGSSPSSHRIGSSGWIAAFLAKYWIYIVGLVLLLISIRTPVVAYEVCYMAFFVVLITVLQASFGLWRVMLFCYWMFLTGFSIIVLLGVYTYQFTDIPRIWYNWTHWPSETFADLGLVQYDAGNLFVQLLTPLSFLTVVILQLKFFHSAFMRLTNFGAQREVNNRTEVGTANNYQPEAPGRGERFFQKAQSHYESVCNFLWRFGELHFPKLVALSLMLLAVYEVNAVNFVFVVLVCLLLGCRRLNTLLSVIATIWAALIVLAKMIYQMRFVKVDELELEIFNQNCSAVFAGRNASQKDSPAWAGFNKLHGNDLVSTYLQGYVIVFVLLTFQAIIKIRQKYQREVLGQPTPARGVLFPDVGRQDADDSIVKCVKYLINYGFYKFGVEITFIVVVITIGVRMDAVAFVYAVWLLILVALSRRVLAHGVWYVFSLFVAVALVVQYAVVVGLPPSACIQYPWIGYIRYELIYWLYLPSYVNPPQASYLIGDFFILLMAAAQCNVFRIETSSQASVFEGGDNAPIPQSGRGAGGEAGVRNPTPNFITYTKSYLDLVKMFVFVYFHWITLFVVFAAGVGGISAFAFGYLVAAFTLLWKGNDLYLEPHRKVMLRWYVLLFYAIGAILLKVAMNVIGCVFICDLCGSNASWVIQLFSIACLRGPRTPCPPSVNQQSCDARPEESEIIYDAICFAFLVFQIRIFSSWYFRHSIAEFRAERILSSRGAFLMNLLIQKEMTKQKVAEDKILQDVKKTTARIRENYVAQMEGKKFFEPNSYAEAKRSGDYYMFDDEEPVTEDIFESRPLAPEIEPGADVDRIGPTQLLDIAGTQDLNIDDIVDHAKRRASEIEGRSSGAISPKSTTLLTARSPTAQVSSTRSSTAPLSSQSSTVQLTTAQSPSSTRVGDVRLESRPMAETNIDEDVRVEDGEEKKKNKFASCIGFIAMLFESALNRLTYDFNRWSRDYRYVAFVLKGEKQRLKERLLIQLENEDDFRQMRETIFNNEISRDVQQVHNQADIEATEGDAQKFAHEHNVVGRFFIALFYLLVSHTELLCYLMMVLDQMGNAAIISLPLPLFAFFWGTLCSPRPPKFFWVTVITYTEAMIVVKFMFQFGFWTWTLGSNDPFDSPKILGIDRRDYYAAYDVALLMMLFFHRYVLKGLGLWKDVKYEEPDVVVDEGALEGEKDSFELQEMSGRTEVVHILYQDEANLDDGDVVGPSKRIKPGQARMAYCSNFSAFYHRLLRPMYRYIMDLYAFMFLCDIICFLVVAFGYSSFGVGKGDVVADIQSNKIPLPFVVMLIGLMVLIIIDRAIYLRKSVMAKLVFQYLLVTTLHIWIFFGLPALTEWPITRNTAAQIFYFVKCVYFILSAWQIRNGFPSRVQGNLLTKRFGMTNYVFFTAFMAAPFLFELRTLIDWVWTDTSMPLFDYFTMENMYACVFKCKCMRKFEKEYPAPRGIAKSTIVKYGMGLPILILIVVLLWLPLLLFAMVNSIGIRLAPEHATFSIVIEGYPPLYAMEAQRHYLENISNSRYGQLQTLCKQTKSALEFVSEYGQQDIYEAQFRGGASKYWTITSPSLRALRSDLINGTVPIYMSFSWDFVRAQNSKGTALKQSGYNTVILNPNDEARLRLFDMIPDPDTPNFTATIDETPPAVINYAFPPFIIMPSIGPAKSARPVLYVGAADTKVPETYQYANVSLRLVTEKERFGDMYWDASMFNWTHNEKYSIQDGTIDMTVFVDRVFPSALDSVTSGGIIGLYVLVVLAAARIIRSVVVNTPTDVILNEMPNVDRIVILCQNLFLVREARDFLLEQDLFAKLVFLFRSPETLIRWTRPKVE